MQRVVTEACTWVVFFLISDGPGYPALNRYDPASSRPMQ